jgi:hypothetical protein
MVVELQVEHEELQGAQFGNKPKEPADGQLVHAGAIHFKAF